MRLNTSQKCLVSTTFALFQEAPTSFDPTHCFQMRLADSSTRGSEVRPHSEAMFAVAHCLFTCYGKSVAKALCWWARGR